MQKMAHQMAKKILEKLAISQENTPSYISDLSSAADQFESSGRTVRNVGLGGALGLGATALAAPLLSKNRAGLLRKLIGGAAVGSGLIGLVAGSAAPRSAAGYREAINTYKNKKTDTTKMPGLDYSPTAYREAMLHIVRNDPDFLAYMKKTEG